MSMTPKSPEISGQSAEPSARRSRGGPVMGRRGFLRGAAVVAGLIAGGGAAAALAERRPALSIEQTLAPRLMSRAELEANSQKIKTRTEVVNQAGDVTKEYVVLDNKLLYESHMGANQQFSEFKAVGQIPIENPTAIATSSDGNTIIIGGEDPIRSSSTKVLASYDAGKTWKSIPWPYVLSGTTMDLFRITDDIYLGNNGNYEGGIGQFFVRVDRQTQSARVQAASLENIQAARINTGSAYDLSVQSIDITKEEITAISNGSFNLINGFQKIRLNYATGNGVVEQIKTVSIDGQQTELGFLYGRAEYVDSNGHTHFVAYNIDEFTLYDIDTVTNTATRRYTADLLDNSGIPNLMKERFRTSALHIITDANGRRNTWLAGRYPSRLDGLSRAVLVHLESGKAFELSPTRPSGVSQRNFSFMRMNGQAGFRINIENLGQAFFPINPDGSPIPNATPLNDDKGLGSALQGFRVYAPLAETKRN